MMDSCITLEGTAVPSSYLLVVVVPDICLMWGYAVAFSVFATRFCIICLSAEKKVREKISGVDKTFCQCLKECAWMDLAAQAC